MILVDNATIIKNVIGVEELTNLLHQLKLFLRYDYSVKWLFNHANTVLGRNATVIALSNLINQFLDRNKSSSRIRAVVRCKFPSPK